MDNQLLEIANAVKSAVARVPVPERGRTVAMGADGTPTSYIDRVAEDAILEYIEERHFPANLLSEEAGYVERGFGDILVVDPVDGTHNACSGIPFYSVSLAIGRGSLSGLTEGLVMNLINGDVFHATRGEGATLNGQPISVREPDGDMLLMAYLGSSALPGTYAIANRFKRVRSLGCVSLELCSVACGQADAFFIDYANTEKCPRVIDIAAAVVILREAGGEAYDANQEILDMPLSLEVRKSMMASNSRKALELME
ncbi:MAG: inositol monophosphatase family protein [Thermoplasmata archaeon]